MCRDKSLRLDGREAHHALHVLRVKRGEQVAVLDGAGMNSFAKSKIVRAMSMTLRVTQKKFHSAPPCPITLLQAIAKGKNHREHHPKIRRTWRASHRAAADRARRRRNSTTKTPPTNARNGSRSPSKPSNNAARPGCRRLKRRSRSGQFLARPGKFDLSLVGSLQTERRHPRECFQEFEAKHGRLPQTVGVWIGPEGDFTLEELKRFRIPARSPFRSAIWFCGSRRRRFIASRF